MIWALLAILGVPLWLVVGALSAALISRRRFRAQVGVFPLAQRAQGATRWPRTPAYGRVISDVLIVNRGLALQRTTIHQILDVNELTLTVASTPKHMSDATARTIDLDDGTTVEVAFPASEANPLVRPWPPHSTPDPR